MTINDKIKQILIERNLTPSYFADEIGVQRSSISHILSGRNRPSFDIIQKIIRRFPDLGYEWIMEEDAQGATQQVMPTGYGNRNVGRPVQNPIQNAGPATYMQQPVSLRNQRTEIPPHVLPTQPVSEDEAFNESMTTNTIAEKKVERILIFYTDGSFREFTPS